MKSFGGRFLENWLRWGLWILFLGVGFHGGQLVALLLHHALTTGLIIFVTGVLGYAIGGISLGALVALIPSAFQNLRIFPTTIQMGVFRVLIIGFVLGLWSVYSDTARYIGNAHTGSQVSVASTADTSSPTSAQKAACFDAYSQGRYKEALNGCKELALIYAPRLTELRTTKDERVVLNDAYALLRVTYTTSLAYGKLGDPENARQAALHCVGWGLFVVGSISDLNKSHSNEQYAAMQSEAITDMQALDKLYPGVIEEERKAFAESVKP